MNITNLNQIKRNPELRIRKVQEQYYIFDRHKCYAVNTTGAIVVHALEKDYPMQEFLDRLSKKFNMCDINQLQNDVLEFLDFLEREELVSIK